MVSAAATESSKDLVEVHQAVARNWVQIPVAEVPIRWRQRQTYMSRPSRNIVRHRPLLCRV